MLYQREEVYFTRHFIVERLSLVLVSLQEWAKAGTTAANKFYPHITDR